LSGWKHYVFEGGVRSAAFIFAPGLANPGTVHRGLFHAVDWLPTLAKLGGASTDGTLPLDGFDIWLVSPLSPCFHAL
jgi:arylsulfatase B